MKYYFVKATYYFGHINFVVKGDYLDFARPLKKAIQEEMSRRGINSYEVLETEEISESEYQELS